jgi:hypothetical protein
MVESVDLYLLLAKAAVLTTGMVIVFYTARAASHTGDHGLWLLTLGIGLAGLGLFLSGLLGRVVGIEAGLDSTLTSTIAAIGLAIVIYSMFRDPRVPVESE